MDFSNLYHNYKYIRRHVIGKDIRNVGPTSLFSNIVNELLYLLWPDTTPDTESQNKKLLYALTYVAIIKSPINEIPYLTYLRENLHVLINIDKPKHAFVDNTSIIMENILCENNIYMLDKEMPNHIIDIIELKNVMTLPEHECYKYHGEVISVYTSETNITQRKIHKLTTDQYIRDILRTRNIEDSIYKDLTIIENLLYWLNDYDKTKLITNIFKELDILIVNAESSKVDQTYLENSIVILERLLPNIINVRLKINNAVALGCTLINIADMLLQDTSYIENVEIPEIIFNTF